MSSTKIDNEYLISKTLIKVEKDQRTFQPPFAFPNPDQISAAFPVTQLITPFSGNQPFFSLADGPSPRFPTLEVAEELADSRGFFLADIWNW
jgi:hypothetical protein